MASEIYVGSTVLSSFRRLVDRGALEERIGAVPDWLMAQIDAGLARALALAHL